MKYQILSSSLYISNRTRLSEKIQTGGLAVFSSNDIYPTSADGTMAFKQASDIFYLTGVDQEETILILFPSAQNPAHREILFLKETSEHIAIWEGAKLTKEQAHAQTGIRNIQWVQDFDKTMRVLMNEANTLYLNDNAHTRATIEVETREMRLSKKLQSEYPHHTIARIAPAMHHLRAIKQEEEIIQLQRAIDITQAGFERVLQFVKPGVMEYEIEAEFAHEFLRRGSRGFAYTPIIASGSNACVLHYIANDLPCKEGDVILLDVGAEYGNYNADMTRCIPVSGRFTVRQKDVYNAVLRVMKSATTLLRPGTMIGDYHKAVGEMMSKELVDLGLITMEDIKNENPAWPAYKKYFMHGTSHFLGLDVHDVGDWNIPMQVGNVFTVEPGIYIPNEGLGIRIENNVVIEDQKTRNLFASFPTEVEEIEDWMNR
jgi:Xaa-Pro aminopeptidase